MLSVLFITKVGMSQGDYASIMLMLNQNLSEGQDQQGAAPTPQLSEDVIKPGMWDDQCGQMILFFHIF